MTYEFICDTCGEAYRRQVNRPGTCGACQLKRNQQWAKTSGAAQAAAAVTRARWMGKLANPKTLKCVDCQKQASQYDHRDYNKPLKVEPVCASCNKLRGKARPLRNVRA